MSYIGCVEHKEALFLTAKLSIPSTKHVESKKNWGKGVFMETFLRSTDEPIRLTRKRKQHSAATKISIKESEIFQP